MDPRLESVLASGILALRGVEERPSRFDGRRSAFWIAGREFAHVEGAHLDVRLTRREISARRAELSADPRVQLRGGDWLKLSIATDEDVHLALHLVGIAAGAQSR